VNSGFSRNMAVNIWWSPLHSASSTKFLCDDQEAGLNLSDLNFSFGEWVRYLLIELATLSSGRVDFVTINKLVVDEHTGRKLITNATFEYLDTNSDGFVTVDELDSLSSSVIHAAVQHTKIGKY